MESQLALAEERRQEALCSPMDSPPLSEEPEDATAERQTNPARRIMRFLLPALLVLLAWYVASDRMAPSSSSGFVAAYTAQIAPRVSGEVTQVLVADNQRVEKGDILMRLDPRPFMLAVEQAEANLDLALQNNRLSQASVESARAQLSQAEAQYATLEKQFQRTQTLFESGVVPKAKRDQAETELTAVHSALQMAEFGLERALISAGADSSDLPQVAAARAQLDQARLNLSFATVRAPDSGVITNLNLAVGRFVGAGSPAMTFIASDEPWIMVDLRENQLGNVDPGDEAGVLFDGQPGRVYRGRVHSVAWGIDPGRVAPNGLLQNTPTTRWFEPARTIPVHIKLDSDTEDWPENVRVGSKVNVVIYAEGRQNLIAWIAGVLQNANALVSYLY